MKIWPRLMKASPVNKTLFNNNRLEFVQVREWKEGDKGIPLGFIPDHGFVSLHHPETGDYIGWCGKLFAETYLTNATPAPDKFQHRQNSEPVYQHTRKYEMATL